MSRFALVFPSALAFLSSAGWADPAGALEAWSKRLDAALAPPVGVRLLEHEGSFVMADRGASLVLADARLAQAQLGGAKGSGAAPTGAAGSAAKLAMDAQLEPFIGAGAAAPAVETVSCTVVGRASQCLSAVVEVAPGARMRLLSAAQDDWTAVCLDRHFGANWPAVCAPVLGS